MTGELAKTSESELDSNKPLQCHDELSSNRNDDLTNSEEPSLKRQKVKEKSSSASPSPSVFLNETSELTAKVEGVTASSERSLESDNSRANSVPVTQESSLAAALQTTGEPSSALNIVKRAVETKQTIPTQSQPAKADLVRQSGRKVEDIIDGSDLRKFLNKSLTEYIVKGLDEIVELWEKGAFYSDMQDEDQNVLKKKVVLKFADIIKQLGEE